MALIVTAGAADAESYCSVADASSYHTARGNAGWTGTDAVKEAALRRATDHMTQTYAERWKGERASSTQALDWPRYSVVVDGYELDSDAVPVAIQRACAELALRALTEPLAPDLDRQVTEETVDVITTKYEPGARESKKWTAAENLMRPYLMGANGLRLERA